MKEQTLLDHTCELLEMEGPRPARVFLEANQARTEGGGRAQIENFRYCLAAQCGDKAAALELLRAAIQDKGLWYRPEVLEDGDLDLLRDEPLFHALAELSRRRWAAFSADCAPVCTWKGRRADALLLALHGNQENMSHASAQWEGLRSPRLQVEYLQSGEPDCTGLFRWEADGPGPQQLAAALDGCRQGYEGLVLGGFSAGCNVLCRALAEEAVTCGALILVGPWLPCLEAGAYAPLLKALEDTRVLLICGKRDGDCLPGARALAEVLERGGVDCTLEVPAGLGHGFPSGFQALAAHWLNCI